MDVRVLITDNDLGDSGFEVELLRRSLDAQVFVRSCRTEADVLEAVAEVNPHAMIVQWAPVTGAVLDAAPACRLVSRVGIGLDMVDLTAAEARRVIVRNVPHYCTEEAATHAVALGLSLWRRLPAFDGGVRGGEWNASATAGQIMRLSTATVGLIGMGRIGRLVADAYAVWGARVIVHDPVHGDDPYDRVSLDVIAAESDLISLHAPLLAETHHIVDGGFLSGTRRRPYLVNVSRGELVDTVSVAEALTENRLAGAGIDVFEVEPLAVEHPLRHAPNTILTPHAAWCSADALPELRRGAVMNVVEAFGSFSKSAEVTP